MERIYFRLKNGDIVSDYDIAKCFYLINNKDPNVDYKFFGWDKYLDLIRVFAPGLFAVDCEIEPSDELVRELVKSNRLITAVKLHRDLHPAMSLLEAKQIIDRIREEIISEKKEKE